MFQHRTDRFIADKQAFFAENGYVVFEKAISDDVIDEFWRDAEHQISENPALRFSVGEEIFDNKTRWSRKIDPDGPTLRVIDMERHSAPTVKLALNDIIVDFLRAEYSAAPTCIQTLTYEKSSEQGPHSDKYLVAPPTVGMDYNRESLRAAWIACEATDEKNGALILYPGSHRLAKKQYGKDIADYGEYMRYLDNLCEENECSRKTFYAAKGDILFWHADFVHAGGAIKDRTRTRKSLVAHYAQIPRFRRIPEPGRTRKRLNGGYYYS